MGKRVVAPDWLRACMFRWAACVCVTVPYSDVCKANYNNLCIVFLLFKWAHRVWAWWR